MHIAVFLQHYHTPDCPTAARPYALVERLARDHRVTVITTTAWEDKRIASRFPWVPDGVDFIRLDVPYDNSMSSGERLLSFLNYAARAVFYGLKISKPDLILGSSTPLTAAAAAALVASLRGVPWIFEVRDLWPDFPIQMGAIPWTSVQKALYALERLLYQSAEHVVALSDDMTQHVQTVAPQSDVTTLEYGSDFRLLTEDESRTATLQSQYSLDRRFIILYAGTFGRANAIPNLLETAKQFDGSSNVFFVFAGQGYFEPHVKRAANTFDHIRHLPPLAYPEALSLFSLADISLVPFLDRPVLAANAPGKLFDSLAAGTPVIVTNPGWTRRLVLENECGWYVPPESAERLADRLRTLLSTPQQLKTFGENARALAKDRYRRSSQMNRYARLVRRIEAGT